MDNVLGQKYTYGKCACKVMNIYETLKIYRNLQDFQTYQVCWLFRNYQDFQETFKRNMFEMI